jgi:methionine sulfoxide reductase heme-binding subunit
VPLAVTSTSGWMRRLGPSWHRLHRLVYPAAILGVTHFWWQVKADWREPAVYAVLLAGLLAWRVRRARRCTASPGAVVASG